MNKTFAVYTHNRVIRDVEIDNFNPTDFVRVLNNSEENMMSIGDLVLNKQDVVKIIPMESTFEKE